MTLNVLHVEKRLKSIINFGRENYYLLGYLGARLAQVSLGDLYFHEVLAFQWPHWLPDVLEDPIVEN